MVQHKHNTQHAPAPAAMAREGEGPSRRNKGKEGREEALLCERKQASEVKH
jgi:hypothetical protein